MTTLTQDIRGALQKRLDAISGFPAEANRAYQGRGYTPTPGTPWARAVLTVAEDTPFATGGSSFTHRGLFIVTHFVDGRGNPGPGSAGAEIASDNIAAAFKPPLNLLRAGLRVRIERAERTGLVEEPDWLSVPVQIRWMAWSPRA